MAVPSYRLVGVGAFVVGGLTLFAIGLFMIGERRLLFTSHFEVFAEWERVTGLQPGATVRVSGLDAGEVLEIQVPRQPEQRFRVRMRVREDLRPLVRTDSVASIQTEGLIGSRFVQIERGSTHASPVPDGGTIEGREPFDFTDLLQQASNTITEINEIIEDLADDLKETIAVTAETVKNVDSMVDEIEDEVTRIAKSGRAIAGDIEVIIDGVREGRGTVGKLVNDDELYERATRIAAEAEDATRSVRAAVQEARETLADFRANDQPGGGVVADLRRTVEAARDAMNDLADATEAIKRNWLLRGFFRDRGYYDLDTLSVDDYRAGALERDGRRALRLWIDARYLFAQAPDGDLTLTDGGRARLESAMSEVLRHARETLLIVEGYSEAPTREERYRESRRRAAIVREYVAGRYELAPNRVGIMPMGLEAPGSPRQDDRWSGVALAAFVERPGNR